MANDARPTNEHIIKLLERVLDELADLADRQRQIEVEVGRLVGAPGS